MTDLPSLTTTYAYIRKDESQQESLKSPQVEISALAIQAKVPAPYLQQGPPPSFPNHPRQCSHCHGTNHAVETCWVLYPHLKPKKQSYQHKAKAAAMCLVQEPDFHGVIGQDHSTISGATPSASIVGRSKIGMAPKISTFVGDDTWIVDSGASDHKTYNQSYFTEFSSPPVSHVINVNGESYPVLGMGQFVLPCL